MNSSDYIASGILEQYVAGALSQKEMEEVEAMAAQYPEIRQEIAEIEMAIEALAMSKAVAPPQGVLERVMAEVQPAALAGGKTIRLQPDAKKANNSIRYLAYAASILLLISLGINIFYYNSYRRVENELADISDQNTVLANQFDVIRASNTQLAAEMQVFKNKDYIAITMHGAGVSPGSMSIVYWDKSTGDLYVNANNLPAPAEGMQYQLWALKDGKPIDAGMFNMNGALQSMKKVMEADAFAVTLEPQGGSEVPSLDRLYVMGGV